jgi:hypothetical protein
MSPVDIVSAALVSSRMGFVTVLLTANSMTSAAISNTPPAIGIIHSMVSVKDCIMTSPTTLSGSTVTIFQPTESSLPDAK